MSPLQGLGGIFPCDHEKQTLSSSNALEGHFSCTIRFRFSFVVWGRPEPSDRDTMKALRGVNVTITTPYGHY